MTMELSTDESLVALDRVLGDVSRGFDIIAARLERLESLVSASETSPLPTDLAATTHNPTVVQGVDQQAPVDDPFGGHYDTWRDARVAGIFECLGQDAFDGQTVLEVGAGFGDLGNMLSEHGAIVTCAEGRAEHVEVLKERHAHLEAMVLDLDHPPELDRQFDWVLHLGVLYHLNDPQASLEFAASISDRLILETEVTDSLDPDHEIKVLEHGYDQSLSGEAIRISAARVERMLDALGYRYTRIDDPIFNADIHVYDWKELNTGGWRHGLRRIWIAERIGAGPVQRR